MKHVHTGCHKSRYEFNFQFLKKVRMIEPRIKLYFDKHSWEFCLSYYNLTSKTIAVWKTNTCPSKYFIFVNQYRVETVECAFEELKSSNEFGYVLFVRFLRRLMFRKALRTG